MLCTNCKEREASFHYKQISGGKLTEQHLCHSCAKALGYLGQHEGLFDIGSILNDFITIPKTASSAKGTNTCPVCMTTYEEFRQTGLLGCDKCYDTFGNIIESSLSRIQPSTTHKGTLAGEAGEKIRKENEMTNLKDELKKAIIDERYEDAAVIRDKIRKLEERENG